MYIHDQPIFRKPFRIWSSTEEVPLPPSEPRATVEAAFDWVALTYAMGQYPTNLSWNIPARLLDTRLGLSCHRSSLAVNSI
jgi:hypothetical protein